MFRTISKSLVAFSLFSVTVACSQQEAPKSQKIKTNTVHLRDQVTTANQPVRNDANALLSCDEIWAGFVAANPLGLSKAYRSTYTTTYAGGEGLPADETVVETSKDTVSASSDTAISITYEFTSTASATPIPAETQSLTKVDFLASCNAPAPVETTPAPVETPAPAAAAEPTVEILGNGTESLAVEAGVFDTEWVKGKITQTGENAYVADAQEWYLVGSDFLVKSTFVSVSTFDTISVTSSQTVELISYVNPAAPVATPAS